MNTAGVQSPRHSISHMMWQMISESASWETQTPTVGGMKVLLLFFCFFLNLSHIASGASLTACAGAPQLIEITIAGAAVSR